ncbi:phosphotransferase [Saccharopolyspora mangrovi]|uniref:Phosphotransferase n=1 Tax=Saccharopolyspora mangrovi TaxID=3082379 RepID=A0ABU6AC84_9PSEU|nr:phosphotransferase [Saccharopolyspora sp. S2-29]MEB3369177.1 phosphotransferase [Saccharopolyspora sp. S2-29]
MLDTGWLAPHTEADARVLAEVYGPAVDAFIARVGNLLSAKAIATLKTTVDAVAEWSLARGECSALLHGDYRLDNLMVRPDTGEVRAVDWQTLSLGLPAPDLAYLISTGMTPDERRAHEHDLVADYHRGLRAHGVTDYTFETCWQDYRLAMLQAALVPVFGCAYGTRTDRGRPHVRRDGPARLRSDRRPRHPRPDHLTRTGHGVAGPRFWVPMTRRRSSFSRASVPLVGK